LQNAYEITKHSEQIIVVMFSKSFQQNNKDGGWLFIAMLPLRPHITLGIYMCQCNKDHENTT